MQGVQSDRQTSSQTKTRLAGSKSASSPKAPKENVVVDKTKFPSAGPSNPLARQLSYIESNASREKCVMSEDFEHVTDLKSLRTPINLYEDECAFCHSFRTSLFHGPMVRYRKGRIVSTDQTNLSNGGIYVHRKCLEWSPRVWFEGDTIWNVESEIRRASRLKCCKCGLKGAALGCYYERCNKTFHVPCAVQIYDCRWDVDNGHVLCPEHVSQMLPCNNLRSQTKESQFSSLPQREESFMDFQEDDQQNDHLSTRSSIFPSGEFSEMVQNFDDRQGDNQETDSCCPRDLKFRNGTKFHIEASNSSSLPKSCRSDEDGISNACQGKEMKVDQRETPSYSSDKLVLLGSSLSVSEQDFLQEFARWTKARMANEWGENVTHVIVGKNAGSAWSRSYEVLMAILFGKWVVRAEWMVDSLEMRPNREDLYEVTSNDDSNRLLDGPKKGRTRAAEGAPTLFAGLHFCLSICMSPGDRGRMRNLIAAAGGCVLERSASLDWRWARGDSPPRPYFVYDGGAPTEFSASSLRMEMAEASEHAAAGARVISHLTVMHAIAAYDAQVLDEKRGA